MDVKKGFQRYFMIFDNEDPGFEAGQKPSGYIRLEVRDGRGKLHASVQNLRPGNGRFMYMLYLLRGARDGVTAVAAGELVAGQNKSELEWSFDPSNVGASGCGIEEYCSVAVLVEYADRPIDNIICPLAAYRNGKTEWRNGLKRHFLLKQHFLQQERQVKQTIPYQRQSQTEQVKQETLQQSRPQQKMPSPAQQAEEQFCEINPVLQENLSHIHLPYHIHPQQNKEPAQQKLPQQIPPYREELQQEEQVQQNQEQIQQNQEQIQQELPCEEVLQKEQPRDQQSYQDQPQQEHQKQLYEDQPQQKSLNQELSSPAQPVEEQRYQEEKPYPEQPQVNQTQSAPSQLDTAQDVPFQYDRVHEMQPDYGQMYGIPPEYGQHPMSYQQTPIMQQNQPAAPYQTEQGQVNTGCVYLNGNMCGAFVNDDARAANPCDTCRMRHAAAMASVPVSGDIALLKEEIGRYFEENDPFHSRRSDYIWWKVTNPVNLNNILYQCNIRSPLLFNPAVMMAHYKYRHLIIGIFQHRESQKQYVVCGVPGMHMVDRKPFGEMSRWVQAEGNRSRYGAFGYWLVYIDPDDGKILNLG